MSAEDVWNFCGRGRVAIAATAQDIVEHDHAYTGNVNQSHAFEQNLTCRVLSTDHEDEVGSASDFDLMDEPLANLDPPHQVDWLEQMQCLRSVGTTVVSVLQEIGIAVHADDIVVMREGQVIHHGAAMDAVNNQAIEAVFERRIRIVPFQGQWIVLPSI